MSEIGTIVGVFGLVSECESAHECCVGGEIEENGESERCFHGISEINIGKLYFLKENITTFTVGQYLEEFHNKVHNLIFCKPLSHRN